MGKRRRDDRTPPPDYTVEQRIQDALRAFGCPRPEKAHHRLERDARRQMNWTIRTDARTDHDGANTYLCRCGMGWVWGHRRTVPETGEAATLPLPPPSQTVQEN